MTTNPDGYITDVPYIQGFYSHLAPNGIRHALTVNRVIPPAIKTGFRYLELGCGLGRSLTVLAAAHPEGQFVGVDVNPSHTAIVQEDITAGRLTNASIITSDFSSLPSEIGAFDFIALHGVYSWVAPEVRKHIRAVVAKHLKPGGAFVVSYNAMPGWAHLLPIRTIIRQYAALRTGDSITRVRDAVSYLAFLRDKKSRYFSDNPKASAFIDMLLKSDPHYLAHEYLNEHWEAAYFADVAEFFAPAGVEFVASLPLFTNFLDLSAPPEFRNLFRSASNRTITETHKDFCANTIFRWDIYAKSPRRMMSLGDRLQYADDIFFSVARTDTSLPIYVELGIITSSISGPLYRTLFDLIGTKGLRLSQIIGAAELKSFVAEEITNAVDIAVALGVLAATPQQFVEASQATALAKRIQGDLNIRLLQQAIAARQATTLASPITGSGVIVEDLHALFLAELVTGGGDNIVERIAKRLAEAKAHLTHNGRSLTDEADSKLFLEEMRTSFFTVVLPRLEATGIVIDA